MPATKIEVNIPGEVTYDVRVGATLLRGLGDYCRSVKAVSNCSQITIITDSNVAPLYLSCVKGSLVSEGYNVSDIVVPAGEESKSCDVIAEVWNGLAELGMTRDSAIVALGGGVIGDLAGFAAATFMRGIPVIQVPTTLLAMVDSSVGGKTGINLDFGKNLIGCFKQPNYVCASTDTLSTLPEREWACGCGEIVKSAVVDSDDFFFWLMENATGLRNRESEIVQEAVARCVVFKAGVVARDKTESCGIRECLNYGHTLAHAIETLTGYGTHSHGAAVAEGMRFAAFLSERILGASSEFIAAQSQLLDELNLPPLRWLPNEDGANTVVSIPPRGDGVVSEVSQIKVAEIIDCMKRDKKVRGGVLRFVLVKDVGNWTIEDIADDDVKRALCDFYGIAG